MAQEATLPGPLDLILELADLERPDWPARSRALNVPGVFLNKGDDDEDQDDEDEDTDEDAEDQDDDRDDADDDQDEDDEDDDEAAKRKANVKKARREAAALRKRLRTAETERDKLKQDLDATKDLEKERDSAQLEVRKLRAAIAAGLDVDDVKRLTGETDEELQEDAESLAERLSRTTKRRGSPSDHGAGRSGKPPRNYDPDAETDPQKVRENARKARRRSRAGD